MAGLVWPYLGVYWCTTLPDFWLFVGLLGVRYPLGYLSFYHVLIVVVVPPLWALVSSLSAIADHCRSP